MAKTLTFFTNPMSRGAMVRWGLEEIGQPYKTELLEYGTTMKAHAYLAINPMGKVPAIKHGDTVVTEVAAILCYLADAFPDAKLAPAPTSPARGDYYRWLFFNAGPLEQAAINKVLAVAVPPERRGMTGYGSLEAVTDTLDGVLSKTTYLAGDAFSMADVYVGGSLGWLMGFNVIEKRPSFEAYVKRLQDRPAAKRAREIDAALMPKKA